MAAGKQGSSSFSVFLVDGYNLLAAKVKNITTKVEPLQEESHGLGDSWNESTPTGMRRGTLTQEGAFFDTGTNNIHTALKAMSTTPRIVCAAWAGNAIGALFRGFNGALQLSYEVLGTVGLLTKANAAYGVTGQVDDGVIVQHHAAKTADWNTKTDGNPVDYATDPNQTVVPITSNSQANPTVVTTPVPHGLTSGDIVVIAGVAGSSPTINGERTVTVITPTTFSVAVDTSGGSAGTGGSFVRGNSSNGGVGYLEVSAAAGFTNFVGKIRDSADDSTYADLITFADNVVAPFAERATVAGTVDRYLSFDGNVTGTGSITLFAGFARK